MKNPGKLDKVGLIDNRPSTHYLQILTTNKITHDTWHLRLYMWHITFDMRHVLATFDMWHVVGGEHSLKIWAPYLLRFGKDSDLKNGMKWMYYKLNQVGSVTNSTWCIYFNFGPKHQICPTFTTETEMLNLFRRGHFKIYFRPNQKSKSIACIKSQSIKNWRNKNFAAHSGCGNFC